MRLDAKELTAAEPITCSKINVHDSRYMGEESAGMRINIRPIFDGAVEMGFVSSD